MHLNPSCWLVALALPLAMAACQPALNWRQVREPALALSPQFPCKPQRVVQGDTGMLQCEAQGKRFVLAWRAYPNAEAARLAVSEAPARLASRMSAQHEALPLRQPLGQRFRLIAPSLRIDAEVWAQDSLYVQAMAMAAGPPDQEAASWFLDQLRLGPKP